MQTRRLTIGGRTAIRAEYSISGPQATAAAVQFRILMPGDEVCGTIFGALPGRPPKDAEQIAATARPVQGRVIENPA